MKLRNKKTGQIGDLMGAERSCPYITICLDFNDGNPRTFDYISLAELNDEWEDYKPAEPLIKDEKIRKAVKAWAEANKIGHQDIIRFNAIEHRLSWISTAIEFNESEALSDLEKEDYTIAELCGENDE